MRVVTPCYRHGFSCQAFNLVPSRLSPTESIFESLITSLLITAVQVFVSRDRLCVHVFVGHFVSCRGVLYPTLRARRPCRVTLTNQSQRRPAETLVPIAWRVLLTGSAVEDIRLRGFLPAIE